MSASALDLPGSRALAGIAGDRGEADDHGDLSGGQLPDLVQSDDQRYGGDDADAGDRGKDFEAPGEDGIGLDPPLDFGLQRGDRLFGGAQLALQFADEQ